jgi:hypothetical protein
MPALAERLTISPEAARSLVKRLRLPRSRSNDGKTLVAVDLSEITHKPLPARSSGGDHAVTALKAKIEMLEAELAKIERSSAGHRADFEHERVRADRLVTELLKATADLMAAREVTARLEGEIAALRPAPQTWWRWLRSTG